MIIAITDSKLMKDKAAFSKRVLELIESPVTYVILREKDWDADEHVSFLLDLMGKSDNTCKKIVINGHVTVARHLGLTYVQLPEGRIDEQQKSHTRYAYAAHSLEAIARINEKPSLFNLISPVAPTDCKPEATPLDAETLKAALALSKAPLVALGGITPAVAQDLKALGFEHIALRSALMTADNLEQALQPFLEFVMLGACSSVHSCSH